MTELPPRYNPTEVEARWYAFWEERGLFKPRPSPKPPFCIVMPPPNITGILHMGHALNNTIQDILARWRRMQGHPTLWLPGTDHAGIATQNVVERKLMEESLRRQDLGREKFVERVWVWKEQYGSTIIRQLKRLGSSCDWSRTRFTMDEGLSRAVLTVFTRLYQEGLITQGDYIINWCPRCQTALSDEEAAHKELQGFLYYLRYPIQGTKEFVTVATTRPETMLGDTAIAVHPDDKRYEALRQKKVILPLVHRELPVIADDFVDPEFGTGCVKVTPAHDPNDFEMGQRHNLPIVSVMNPDGTMNENALDYRGLDRFEAREAILEDLKEGGLLLKVEPHTHSVGHCYRCHTVIEPRLSRQWFVRMKALAAPAIEAVRSGKIRFIPERWTKVYLDWMENIRDWCISRQIWWGHRIPVWTCRSCKGVLAGLEKPSVCSSCSGSDLVQEEDVLDTWFSSWLWPFSTLGWPRKTEDLSTFYPTSTLVTAQEIIFFWVARMIMAGLHVMGEVPFRNVYIHGTVRDDTGAKMSKSLGNIIDPLEVIDEVGADALRFSIVSITAVGQDVFLSREKFEIGRNFANKIWNASRFILLQETPGGIRPLRSVDPADLSLADRWILSRLGRLAGDLTEALEKFRFNEGAGLLYEFFWHEFCDWYLELIKPVLAGSGASEEGRRAAQAVAAHVLETSLRLLHPYMPFVTEEIWQRLPHEGDSLMTAAWPSAEAGRRDDAAESLMGLLQKMIVSVRNIRSELRLPADQPCELILRVADDSRWAQIESHQGYLSCLSRISKLSRTLSKTRPAGCVSALVDEVQIFLSVKGLVDIEKERARLSQQKGSAAKELLSTRNRLQDEAFLNRAPEQVVGREREKAERLRAAIERLEEILKALG